MIHLREKELEKLSAITQVPIRYIQQMGSMDLIDEPVAVDMLIRHDYLSLKRRGVYKTGQIIAAISNEYKISPARVNNGIYKKKKRSFWCGRCGTRIPRTEHERNCGICDKCVIASIEV